jgi:arsenate reductase
MPGNQDAAAARRRLRPKLSLLPGEITIHETQATGRAMRKTDGVYNVLFLCTGNSARSIIAEAIMNRLGNGKFRGYSAGSQPKDAVHPYTIDLLRKLNYDTSAFRSKTWLEFSNSDAPELDFVFTVCDNAAAESCPLWPGQPMTAHWGVPDPAAATGTEAEQRLAFSEAYRMLNARISIFVSLPLRSLDQLSLQQRIENIGRATDDDASAA